MPLPVKLNDVIEALDAAGEEHAHYLDKRTGEIVLITNDEMEAAEEDELISGYPLWQSLPGQFETHEYKIMEDFCLEFEDRKIGEEVLRQIKGSGAFGRFRNAINSIGIEKAWYGFRGSEFEKIAIGWLEEEGIAYTREDVLDASTKAM